MTATKDALLNEIEATPDELLQELLDFLRFIKARRSAIPSDSGDLESQPVHTSTAIQPPFRPASGRSLLRHAGQWAGDDLEACLQQVYETRSEAEFSLNQTV